MATASTNSAPIDGAGASTTTSDAGVRSEENSAHVSSVHTSDSDSESPPWQLSDAEKKKWRERMREKAREVRERSLKKARESREKGAAAAEAFSSVLSRNVEKFAKVSAKASKKITTKVIDGKKKRTPLQVVQYHDQLVFTASVANLVVMSNVIGTAPWFYYIWHTVVGIALMAHRWVDFRSKNWHYYMYDFCYWANALSLVYCWVLPHQPSLFRTLFMMAHGPLGMAIFTFTNSLIFHSASHMASMFIHLSPCVLAYTIRWYPSSFTVCERWPECDDTTAVDLFFGPFVYFYCAWSVLYFLWIYVLMDRRIRDRGYETLFGWVINQKPMEFLRRLSSNHWVQKAGYSVIHAVFTLATMVLSYLSWHSWHFNTLYLVWMLVVASWNASGYYFRVFAKRYVDELEKRALTREESTMLLAASLEATPSPDEP